MRRATVILAIGLHLGLASTLAAQQDTLLSVGARVRVWVPSLGIERMLASVISMDSHTLGLQLDGVTDQLSLDPTVLTRLEVSHRTQSRALPGAALGFLAGAVAGSVLGYTAGHTEPPYSDGDYGRMGAIFGAVAGGAVGALLGAVIGSKRAERWVPVQLPIRIGVLGTRYPRL